MKTIVCFKKRMEKRNALNVIPVLVRHQHVSFHSAVAAPSRPAVMLRLQLIAEHSQAGAAIQNEVRVAGRREFEARRVSAVAPGVALERRRGAAHSPEN